MAIARLEKLIPQTKIIGKGEIRVSSKGIINGLSEYINDGADFGPDTTSGATQPSQIDAPYTQTYGIREAINYAISIGKFNPAVGSAGGYMIPTIKILSGVYNINENITISGNGKIIANLKIVGESTMSPYLICNINSGYAITLDPSSFRYTDILFESMQPLKPSGYTPDGFLNIDFSGSPNFATCPFVGRDIDISNGDWGSNPVRLIGLQQINMYNYQEYQTNPGILVKAPAGGVSFFGGYLSNSQFIDVSLVSITGVTDACEIAFRNVGTAVLIGSVFTIEAPYYDGTGGGTVNNLIIIGGFSIPAASPFSNYTGGTFTVNNLIVRGLYYNSSSDTVFINNDTASPVKILNSDIKNIQYGGSGVLTGIPANTPTTPSVPASGTAQQNTYLYPVKVYVNGGAITEIQITINGTAYTVYSNSTASAVYEGFTLPAGASITLTYTTAPTWSWVPE